MGALLSHFKERELKDAFIDFENAKPNEGDELGLALQAILDRSSSIIKRISEYKGCGGVIREAMSKPGMETEQPAWDAVLPCVRELKEFFDYSIALEAHLPKLLTTLSSEPKANLTTQQSQAKQLADICNFTMLFDEQKMKCPQLQNDFAFYRRVMSRHPTEQVVSDDDSYKMSMFFAHSNPMMKTLTNACTAIARKADGANVAETLAHMCNVCFAMVDQKKFDNAETNQFCNRVMTACIILFDATHPMGAFFKKSPILIKKCILQLKAQTPLPEMLINSIKFTCQHLNDEDTPANIKSLFD